MGNPLINELIIGTGSKDRFSMDDPTNDGQFVGFFAQPLLADIFKSIGVPVPAGPRTDLALLVQYTGPTDPGRHAQGSGGRPAARQHRHSAHRRPHSSSASAC